MQKLYGILKASYAASEELGITTPTAPVSTGKMWEVDSVLSAVAGAGGRPWRSVSFRGILEVDGTGAQVSWTLTVVNSDGTVAMIVPATADLADPPGSSIHPFVLTILNAQDGLAANLVWGFPDQSSSGPLGMQAENVQGLTPFYDVDVAMNCLAVAGTMQVNSLSVETVLF